MKTFQEVKTLGLCWFIALAWPVVPVVAQVVVHAPPGSGLHPPESNAPPSFEIITPLWAAYPAIDPPPTMSQGDSTTYPIGITPSYNNIGTGTFTNAVAWSVSGLPPGITASFSPNPTPPFQYATTILLKAQLTAAVGPFYFNLIGTPPPGVGTVQTMVYTAIVNAPILFSLPKNVDVLSCTETTVGPIKITTDTNVISGPVSLSVRFLKSDGTIGNLPSGVHCTIDPPTSQGPSTTHTLKLSLDAGVIGSSGEIELVIEAKSAIDTVISGPIPIKGDNATITAISPAAGTIPNEVLAKKGTLVTITGKGFCDGDEVEFGNALAVVKPESLDDNQILACVPRYATSGKISLVRKTGPVRATARDNFSVDSIRNQGGYCFHNPIGHVSFQDLTDAFGSDQTQDHINPCWPIFDCSFTIDDPIVAIVLAGLKSNVDSAGGGGLCFGVALSAQRLIHGQRPRGDFLPASAKNNFELTGTSKPVDPLWDYLNSQTTVQLSTEFLGQYVADYLAGVQGLTTSQDIYNAIKSSLLAEETPIIALRYGSKGHIVTAYDVENATNNPGEYWIDVYDPNDQFTNSENADVTGGTHKSYVTQSRIHLLANGNWSLTSTTASDDLSGLFVIRASTIPLNPTLLGSQLTQAGNDVSETTFFGSAGGTESSGTQTSPLVSKTTQLADKAGHMLFAANGAWNRDGSSLLKAAPFAPFVGDGANANEFFVVRSNGPTVQTVTGVKTGADSHVVIGRDTLARVDSVAAPGVVDRLSYEAAGGIGFATEAATKPVTLGLIAKAGTEVKSAEISTTTAGANEEHLQFTADHSGIILSHGSAAPVRVRLSMSKPEGGNFVFDSGAIQIATGESATFTPRDWTNFATVSASIRNAAGTERHLDLPNTFVSASRASVDGIRVTHEADGAGKNGITVQTMVGSIPAGSRAFVNWIARSGGKTIDGGAGQISIAELKPGSRSYKFVFPASGPGKYDVEAGIVILQNDGVIQVSEKHTRIETISF